MAKRNYKPEEIVSKLRQADVLIARGSKVPDVVRAPTGLFFALIPSCIWISARRPGTPSSSSAAAPCHPPRSSIDT